MKIIRFIYITVLAGMLLNSCEELQFGDEFLEKEPSVDVTKDTIFQSLELAERYLWQGYRTLPYGLNLDWSAKGNKLGMDILESLTDLNQSYLSWGGSSQLYYSGQYSAATENSDNRTKYHFLFENSWVGIRIGWNFIENAYLIPDGSPDYIEQLKAEARMLIALHYVDMFRNFGGLPWVNHAYSPTEDTDLPRLTARATLDSIVTLIDKAIPHLPWTVEDPSNWDGRFTQAGAMGLKARILLFGASPLFNDNSPYLDGEASQQKMTWYGAYDATLWTKAAQASRDLIDKITAQGGYALVSTGNPRKDFQDSYYKRGNGEVLISTRVRFKSPGYWDGNYYFYQSAGGYGTTCPTKEYVDMFDMADGTPITDPASGWNPALPWEKRDPRLYETVLVNGDTYQGRKAEIWIGGRERTTINGTGRATGFGIRKFWLDGNAATSINSIVHWPYLRLSEIWLSYAEALNEAASGPSAEAYEAVNKVRNRAGLKNLPTGLTKAQFREAILKERACEFGFEEVRWYDLIRWKKEDVFKQTLHGVNTFKNADNTFRYETFNLPERYWKKEWSPKWYLSAFPPNEVNKGYGLVQNPGWE